MYKEITRRREPPMLHIPVSLLAESSSPVIPVSLLAVKDTALRLAIPRFTVGGEKKPLLTTHFPVGRGYHPSPPVSLLDLTLGTGPPDPSLSHLSDISVTYEPSIRNIPEC